MTALGGSFNNIDSQEFSDPTPSKQYQVSDTKQQAAGHRSALGYDISTLCGTHLAPRLQSSPGSQAKWNSMHDIVAELLGMHPAP